MDSIWDVLLRLAFAPFNLIGWVGRRRRDRIDAERRVRLEVLAANRRLGLADDESDRSPDRTS